MRTIDQVKAIAQGKAKVTAPMGSAPVSAFLIGPIAQYWLIPYMRTEDGQDLWAWLLGRGDTRGIALVFFVAGFIMLIAVLLAFVSRPYRQLTAAYEK